MSYQAIITDSGFPDNDPETKVLTTAGCSVKNIQCRDEKKLTALVATADVLLVQWAPITAEVIEVLDRCRVIVRYGIGVDNIDLTAAKKKGIPVCNVPDYCTEEVADHTIMLALASLRQAKETDQRIRNGNWNILLPRPVKAFSAMTFCLAGYGRIARQVAKQALGLGFTVKTYDPFLPAEEPGRSGVISCSLDEVFETADVLSLHLPLGSDTKHFLNEESLSKFKRCPLIVNTSRGGLIDSTALVQAIQSKIIWGAALDVFEEEPLPAAHPLLDVPEILLSSHVAWYSSNSIPVLQRKAAEEAARAITGEQLKNRIV
jgi:D-3-phosphoglycerate dehydrogenase / 2-oxoglutarate reductase